LLQRPDVEEADPSKMLDNGVGVELPFTEQIRLILADVIRPELVGTTIEVARKLVNGPEISARGAGSVISTDGSSAIRDCACSDTESEDNKG